MHALGFSDDQLEYVQDLNSKGVPHNIIAGSQTQDSTNIQSVWIVRNNSDNTSVYPLPTEQGNLKWQKKDKFL